MANRYLIFVFISRIKMLHEIAHIPWYQVQWSLKCKEISHVCLEKTAQGHNHDCLEIWVCKIQGIAVCNFNNLILNTIIIIIKQNLNSFKMSTTCKHNSMQIQFQSDGSPSQPVLINCPTESHQHQSGGMAGLCASTQSWPRHQHTALFSLSLPKTAVEWKM